MDATFTGANPDHLPLLPADPVPTTLWGVRVGVLAASTDPRVSLLAGTPAEASAVTVAGTTSVCRLAEPANPNKPQDACPEPGSAVVATTEVPLRYVALGTSGSLTYRLPGTPAPLAAVALHVSPFDDQAGGNPLRLTLTDAAGASCPVDLPGDLPALANRGTAQASGTYLVQTVRVPLSSCPSLDAAKVASVSVKATAGTGRLFVRGLDALLASPAPSGTPSAGGVPAGESPAPTAPSASSPPIGGTTGAAPTAVVPIAIGVAALVLLSAGILWRRRRVRS